MKTLRSVASLVAKLSYVRGVMHPAREQLPVEPGVFCFFFRLLHSKICNECIGIVCLSPDAQKHIHTCILCKYMYTYACLYIGM